MTFSERSVVDNLRDVIAQIVCRTSACVVVQSYGSTEGPQSMLSGYPRWEPDEERLHQATQNGISLHLQGTRQAEIQGSPLDIPIDRFSRPPYAFMQSLFGASMSSACLRFDLKPGRQGTPLCLRHHRAAATVQARDQLPSKASVHSDLASSLVPMTPRKQFSSSCARRFRVCQRIGAGV